MSVLIKRIDSSSGGGSKGYPPGNINIIKKLGLNGSVSLRWSEPDDIVVGNRTLSTWSSTVIVRKEGSAPTSIKDGDIVLTNTERNKYKETDLVDSGLTNGKTYYYRFFTMNTDKVYNTDSSMIYDIKILQPDSILKNNTWDQIAAVSEAGIASNYWNIGDEIDLTLSPEILSGDFDETVTLQIWDFDHFDKSDGSGKAGICFGMKNLMKGYQQMNSSGSNSGGWNNMPMRNTVMQNILKSIPSDLKNVIKEVNTYASQGDGNTSSGVGRLSKDKIFLPGFTELFGSFDWSTQSNAEKNQIRFPIFTDYDSRIKKLSNGYIDAQWWWTRSPYCNGGSDFCIVYSDGSYSGVNAVNSCGVCFCFNV